MIVGWRVATHMRTEMVLDALEMARRSRGAKRFVGLVTHSDAGSQFTSVRFTERLDEIGARPSIGTVADSYDCEHDCGAVRPGSDPCLRLAGVPWR
jgi:putative transposase